MAARFLKSLFGIGLVTVLLVSCKQDENAKPDPDGLQCETYPVNVRFNAHVNDVICIENEDIVLGFGRILEDSRCNVPHIDCVWEGRFVMALDVEIGSNVIKDTIRANYQGLDTITYQDFKIEILKVKPEVRPSLEFSDTTAYELEVMLVK